MMTDRRDNGPPMDGWKTEPKPWCPYCCIPAKHCGCPMGEQLFVDVLEAHIVRGEE